MRTTSDGRKLYKVTLVKLENSQQTCVPEEYREVLVEAENCSDALNIAAAFYFEYWAVHSRKSVNSETD